MNETSNRLYRFRMRLLLLIFLFPVFSFAQKDSCDCRELISLPSNGTPTQQFSKRNSQTPYTGVCGTRTPKGDPYTREEFKNGFNVSWKYYDYSNPAVLVTDRVIGGKDSVVAYERSYYLNSGRTLEEHIFYQKDSVCYELDCLYTESGSLIERTRYRFMKSGDRNSAWYSAAFGRYDLKPFKDGPFVFYGGRYTDYQHSDQGIYSLQNTTFPQAQGQYTLGQKTGYWEEHYATGKLCRNGIYVNNREDSTWSYYYPNGNLREQGNFNTGFKEGEWKTWDPDGKLIRVIPYRFNSCEGALIAYFPNGKMQRRVEYKSNLRTGKYESWYDNGQPDSVFSYTSDMPDGECKAFHPNGQLRLQCTYKAGSESGPFLEWYADGKPKTKRCTGCAVDSAKTWFANGQLESLRVRRDKKLDILNWYGNGKPKSVEHFADGKKNGACSYYNKDGVLLKQISYKNDTLNGAYKTFTDAGKPLLDYNYAMHVRNGRCRRWDAQGNLVFDRTYQMGKPIGFKRPSAPVKKESCNTTATSPFAACDSLQQQERLEALTIIAAGSSPYLKDQIFTDSIVISEYRIMQIELSLIALRNSLQGNLAPLNSIGIHTAEKDYHGVEISFADDHKKDNQVYENWRTGNMLTGIPAVDKLLGGLQLSIVEKSFSTYGSSYTIRFTTPLLINGNVLERELKIADPRFTCYSTGGYYSDGEHILFHPEENYSVITLSHGYDDCPSGCIGRQNFTFYVYADGEVDPDFDATAQIALIYDY